MTVKSNPIVDYWNAIQSGEVIANRKITKVYEHLVKHIIEDPYSDYTYDASKAEHAIEFIERFCKLPKAKRGKDTIKLMLWMKAMIASIFGIVHKETGLRKHREVALFVARKNWKTGIVACILLYILICDEDEGKQIISGATTKDQAKLVWSDAIAMIKKNPELQQFTNITVSEIRFDMSNSFFKPLASDSNKLDGYDLSAFCLDEVHEIRDTNMWDVLKDSQIAREEPLAFLTSTMGTFRNGIFDLKYEEYENVINSYGDTEAYTDETILPLIYELDSEKEYTDESTWMKANPAIGVIFQAEELKRKVELSISQPRSKVNLLVKHFNIRQSGETQWLTYEEIKNDRTFDMEKFKGLYAIGGVDLSSNDDLTSASIMIQTDESDDIYVETMYWLPEELLEERVAVEKVPYDIWYQNGQLRLVEGREIHPKVVTEWFLEMKDKYDLYYLFVGYDAWSAKYWVEDMENHFGKNVMVPVRQGAQTLSLPMKSLENKFKSKNLIYNNNPLTQWCVNNTAVKVDENNNIKPIKGKSKAKKIDGLAGILDAYTVLLNNHEQYINLNS